MVSPFAAIRKQARRYSRLPAFTLTELLIVLVIIGILVLMALPSLMPLISRTRSVEAKQMLTHVQALEKTYFYEHSRYSNSLDDIGFEQEKLATENGKANYQIVITSAGPTTFAAPRYLGSRFRRRRHLQRVGNRPEPESGRGHQRLIRRR